jgi:acetyltransferase
MAFVAVSKENERNRGRCCPLCYARPGNPEVAEAAVVVSDEYQGLGLGKRLLLRLVIYARAKGVRCIRGNLQIGNDRMLLLVKRSGLPHETRFVDGIWEVVIDLTLPDQAS